MRSVNKEREAGIRIAQQAQAVISEFARANTYKKAYNLEQQEELQRLINNSLGHNTVRDGKIHMLDIAQLVVLVTEGYVPCLKGKAQ